MRLFIDCNQARLRAIRGADFGQVPGRSKQQAELMGTRYCVVFPGIIHIKSRGERYVIHNFQFIALVHKVPHGWIYVGRVNIQCNYWVTFGCNLTP